MKNILLPTDFSVNAFNAMEYAVQLFKDEDATFHLLNTFTPIAYNIGNLGDGYSTMITEEITRQNSETGLLEIEKKLKEKYDNPKHTFKRISSFNLLINEIMDVVKEEKIHAIVMGTKGATGAKEVFLGTNTMYTIKKVVCPVVAVPDNYTFNEIEEILFPTDFKFSMDNRYLPLLRSICTRHKSQLNVLNVYWGKPLEADLEDTKHKLAAYFKNNSIVFQQIEDVDISEAVEQFQIKKKTDFLVMVNNKHSFFENLLFKPVIKQMVYHTNVPFMVIPSVDLIQS